MCSAGCRAGQRVGDRHLHRHLDISAEPRAVALLADLVRTRASISFLSTGAPSSRLMPISSPRSSRAVVLGLG